MKALFACTLLLLSVTLVVGQQAPPSPPPQRIGGDVAQANLLVKIEPVYPALARAARVQDYVMFQTEISKEGKVTNLIILHGHPLLNDAALEAVRNWQYKPILLNGQAIDVVTTVTINFSFNSPPAMPNPRLPAGGASISGQLRQKDGLPAKAIYVMAVAALDVTTLTPALSAIVQTDATGQYRLEKLPPGSYHVQAAPTGNGPFTLYPGVAVVKDAVAIPVPSNESVIVGIDFSLP
jgi:TonB family protein